MTKLTGTPRLNRGFVVAGVGGLALSSLLFGAVASAATKLPASGVETPSGGTVTETGSTLMYPLFNLWSGGYSEKYPSVTIQTASTGSGTGISEAENGTIDIGASDAYLSPTVAQANPHLKNIPLVISAQIAEYNIPGVTAHLKLTGKVLSEIYQGTITKWNDSAIASANPGVTLPATPIVTLHRSDSSGDTFLWTSYLSKADPSGWGTKVGFNTTVPWPNAPGALGENGNSGMVSGCKATVGCIAYVGISYQTQVLQNGQGYAALGNGHKQFVLPTQQTIAAEAAGFVKKTPGQRDDLAHLRQHQQRLPDRQLRVRHRVRHPVEQHDGQERPVGARVGPQHEVRGKLDVPLAGQLPAASLQGRGAVDQADPGHQIDDHRRRCGGACPCHAAARNPVGKPPLPKRVADFARRNEETGLAQRRPGWRWSSRSPHWSSPSLCSP